jgi:hypothetical protein
MALFHLAQLNVARAIAPLDGPELAGFMAELDRINALAEAAPGFVWRLQGDSGNATDLSIGDDPRFIPNMSVWRSPEELFHFVYRTAHTQVMARRREWFEKMETMHQVLFWVPAGHLPTLEEAMDRLDHLDRHGPSATAFTFKARFPHPGKDGGSHDMKPEPYCSI